MPLLFALILWLVVGYIVFMMKIDLSLFNQYLTIVGIVLVIFPIYQVISYTFQKIETSSSIPLKTTVALNNSNEIQVLPDIYFIILDSYTRQDTLQKYYNFDNQEFYN